MRSYGAAVQGFERAYVPVFEGSFEHAHRFVSFVYGKFNLSVLFDVVGDCDTEVAFLVCLAERDCCV